MLQRKLFQAQDEVEALNADVMRFMAILGLCLMLIFAAMEGVRVSSQSHTANVQAEKQKDEQLNRLSQENLQLKQLNQKIENKIQQIEKQYQQKHQEEKKQAALISVAMSKQLKQLTTALNNEQYKNTRLNERLNKTRANKNLVQKTAQKTTLLSQLPVEQQGYVLRFSDDNAFIELLKQQRIQLVHRVSGKSYQIRHFNTITQVPMQDTYQMYPLTNATVPTIYKTRLSQGYIEQWGVILPDDIQKALQELMQNKKGGLLEINAKGKVILR